MPDLATSDQFQTDRNYSFDELNQHVSPTFTFDELDKETTPKFESPIELPPTAPGEVSIYEEPTFMDKPLLNIGDSLFPENTALNPRLGRTAPIGPVQGVIPDVQSPAMQGVSETLRGAVNSLTTPRNLAYMAGSMGLASTGTTGKILVSALWTALMGKNSIEDAPKIGAELGAEMAKPEDQRDTKKIASLLTQAGIDTFMAAAPAAHLGSEMVRARPLPKTPITPPETTIQASPDVISEFLNQAKAEQGPSLSETAPPETTKPIEQAITKPQAIQKQELTPEEQTAEQARLSQELSQAQPGQPFTFDELDKQAKEPQSASELPSIPSKGIGGETQLAIVPGAKEFIEQDVIPKTIEGAKGLIDTTKGARNLISAPSASEQAGLTAGIIREKAAELAQKDVQARKAFAQARSEMAKWNPNQSLQFIDKVETGATHMLSPDMQSIAANLRDALNQRVRDVRALGTGKLQTVIDDYFPHLWKKESPLSQVVARIFGKRPLTGTKSFLKHRTIPTTLDGVLAGKEPVTWNPIDLTLMKLHEMDRYVMGQKIFQELKAKGVTRFSRSDVPEPGEAKINDSLANVIEYRPTVKPDGSRGAPERVLRGHYFAQEDAARVLNNFLSPGLERFAWYRAVRWMGNTLNMANLGLSGYHLMFTMIDSGTSKLSHGIEQITSGKPKGLLTSARGIAGTLLANQLEAYYKGNKVLQEYSKPGSVGGEYTKVVDALLAGGGRVEMPQMFQNSTLKNFFDAAKSGNYPGAILRAPFAAIHAISYPLMNVIVPRLKLGIFNDMALHEIERMGPGVTRDQFRKVMGKVWDSVDNRMGELVYDNLFWNKTLKDLAFMSVRSVGWNLGTFRELGGGMLDSAAILSRLKRGDPAVTRRMAYMIALPITVGLMGALYQKLRTGQGPQELKDYFYPKTGNTLANGEPERVSFPSYMKDVESVKRHPVQTVINKAHPLPGLIANMLQNRDFYSTEIIHPDDPLIQQVKDELGFVVNSFKPYSTQGAQKRGEIQPGLEPKAESFLGIMPIPAELTRTPAENLAVKLLIDQMPKGSRTKAQFEKSDLERKAITQIKLGKMTVDEAVDKGLVAERRANTVQDRVDTPYLEYAIKHLPAPQSLAVFQKATAKERELIADRVYAKIMNSKSLSDEERDALIEKFESLEPKTK